MEVTDGSGEIAARSPVTKGCEVCSCKDKPGASDVSDQFTPGLDHSRLGPDALHRARSGLGLFFLLEFRIDDIIV
jgi:hypothetical protein